MTFPSAGCQTCKARRIKCDEAQPACHNCIRSRRDCHGTTSGKAWSTIHLENLYASGQKKRPRGPRSNRVVEPLPTNPRLSLINLETQANLYFLRYHLRALQDAHNISKGIYHDLLLIWPPSKGKCPIIDLGFSSLALAVFSRTHHHPHAATAAAAKYQWLLRNTQTEVLNVNESNMDICLLAIFFMGRYEDTICDLNPKAALTMFHSFSHHDGALAVLKIWKHNLSKRAPVSNVIKHTRRGLIRSAFLRTLKLPEWLVDGSAFGEEGEELEYDHIMVRIVAIRQRVSILLDKISSARCISNGLASSAKDLNEEARDIDRALRDWSSHFPSAWGHRRHTLFNSWQKKDCYSLTVYTYSSPAYSAVWNQYYANRMVVNNTRLKILKIIYPNPKNEQRSECLHNMEAMANALASSIPYCLQRFDVTDIDSITLDPKREIEPHMAYLTAWPLSIVSGLYELDIEHRLWFKSQLALVGKATGSGVLEFGATDHWLEL